MANSFSGIHSLSYLRPILKSLSTFIQGLSCKYSSCADLGPLHLAGREPACQARLSHGEYSSLTCWEGADGLHSLIFGMMWASTQCSWIHWMSCNLTCMLRYEIQPHHFSVVSVECYFSQLILFFQVEHIEFQSRVWKNNVSLKFGHVSEVFFKRL